MMIVVDINGEKKPNSNGIDRFSFYIFPEASLFYNCGSGNVAWNVPSEGVYYDGYRMTDNQLKNDYHRGCTATKGSNGMGYPNNAYCIALIVRNGWKIPKDYPVKL